jgi:hypothetical protein
MLGVKLQTSTLAIYGETGRFPLLLRQQIRTLKYWVRLINMPDNHILKLVYSSLLELDNVGHFNWCSRVRHLLQYVEMDNVWDLQTVNNTRIFIGNFTEKLTKLYITN